jgi:hypothetical protein
MIQNILCALREHGEDLARGGLGMGATSTGIYLSLSLPQVEAWLRVVSLLVGIAVGVATFIAILRKFKQ